MGNVHALRPTESRVQKAVLAALSGYSSRDAISARRLIETVRAQLPNCRSSDDELIDMVVRHSTGRTIVIAFDHHDA